MPICVKLSKIRINTIVQKGLLATDCANTFQKEIIFMEKCGVQVVQNERELKTGFYEREQSFLKCRMKCNKNNFQ